MEKWILLENDSSSFFEKKTQKAKNLTLLKKVKKSLRQW